MKCWVSHVAESYSCNLRPVGIGLIRIPLLISVMSRPSNTRPVTLGARDIADRRTTVNLLFDIRSLDKIVKCAMVIPRRRPSGLLLGYAWKTRYAAVKSLLDLPWNRRLACYGIRARFAVESAFGLAWNTQAQKTDDDQTRPRARRMRKAGMWNARCSSLPPGHSWRFMNCGSDSAWLLCPS
jgi:hypothetical protein